MNRIYNVIANNHCVSPEEVEREILFALTEARKSTSPTAKAFWGETKNATAEDIINKLVSRIALVV